MQQVFSAPSLSRLPRWSGVCLLALTLLVSAVFGASTVTDSRIPVSHIKVVCSTSLFRGVSREELFSTADVWLLNIGRRLGFKTENEFILADNLSELQRQVDEGTLDLLISSSLEYLAIDRSSIVKPAVTLTAGVGAKGKIKYLLLVNRDSGITQVDALKGKSINTYSRSESKLNRVWLDVLLETAHLGTAEQFFGHINPTPKPSSSCLPVFFGKADACLIDDPSWATLRELNPQIETKLKVLAESKPMIESLISLRESRQQYRAEILHAMFNLQDDPEGRQVLLFFKCREAVHIDAQDLAEVEELRTNFLKLTPPGERREILPFVPSAAAKAH